MATPVFLGYDREALDREYNNRAKVPDAQARLDWYARESEAARPSSSSSTGATGTGWTRPTSTTWPGPSSRRAPSRR